MQPTILRVISRAQSRYFLAHWWSVLGVGVLIGLLVAVVILITGRLVSRPVVAEVYAALAGVVIVASLAVAWRARLDERAMAVMLDERLDLKDRLASAMHADALDAKSQSADAGFVQQVVDEGVAAANGIDRRKMRAAIPWRAGGVGGVWGYVPMVGAVLAVLGAFFPMLDVAGFEARAKEQQQLAQQAEAVEQEIQDAVTTIEQVKFEADDADDVLADAEALGELMTITSADLSNPEMRRQAAVRLSEVQDRLSDAYEPQAEQFEQIQNMLSALDPGQVEGGAGPADEFADALRRGDFNAAQQAAEKLMDEMDGMSEADKQALQQQLNNMQNQLQQMAKQQQEKSQQQQQQMQQALQQAGMSQQQAQQMSQQMQNGQMNQQQMQQAIQQSLQQQNPSMSQQQAQQQAQQLAQQMQQMQQQSQCSGGSGKQAQQLAQQMQQMQQGQKPGQQGQPGQSGGQNSSSAMSQLAQMQSQMQQMQQAQSQAQQAMQQLGSQSSSGSGGSGAGKQDGGGLYGQRGKDMTNFNTHAEGDLSGDDGRGPIIASWLGSGPNEAGEAQVEYNHAITDAQRSAEHAITDDRVPRRYHEGLKEYFNQLPATPEQATKTAPRAPR